MDMQKTISFQAVISAVRTFSDAFNIPWSNTPTTALTSEQVALRHRLMEEENNEYLEAANAGDMVEVADALGDQLYILCGTILSHGMQDVIEDVFSEIQASNMSKLGSDNLPILREDGKVMKGPNYFRPDISTILTNSRTLVQPRKGVESQIE